MRINDIIEPIAETTVRGPDLNRIKDAVWYYWQEDYLMPAGVEYPEQLDDEDYLDFEEHVKDVYAYAQEHNISNATLAVEKYTDSIDTASFNEDQKVNRE